MKNRERLIVTSVFAVLVFGWLGFLLHVSPRFAGSGLGAVFGISGAVLMLVPLTYVVAKRIPFFKERITKYVSLQTWLSVHVYTGILGALLALIHTGHKYSSPLGIALAATMMLVVVSGFAVRYLLASVSIEMKDKLALLQTARGDLDSAWGVLEKSTAATLDSLAGPRGRVTILAEGVADFEYSVRTHELLKRWFSRALTAHIVLSVSMYALLAAHITSGVYFGLRWLR